jgi:hypothetical protein
MTERVRSTSFFRVLTRTCALSTVLAAAGCAHTPLGSGPPYACPGAIAYRLADSPGPGGHALAFTPWAFVLDSQRPEGLYGVEESAALARGETDEDGRVVMTDAQQQAVTRAYCDEPERVWLLYPGQSQRVRLYDLSLAKDPDERLFYAMVQRDYIKGEDLPVYRRGYFDSDGKPALSYAFEAEQVADKTALLSKLQPL